MSPYNQVGLDPDSRQFTAFTFTTIKFNWTRAPFGLVNNVRFSIISSIINKSDTLQFLAQALNLKPGLYPYICVYVDDLILFTASLEDHMELLRKLLSILRQANLKISAENSKFSNPLLTSLGKICLQKA